MQISYQNLVLTLNMLVFFFLKGKWSLFSGTSDVGIDLELGFDVKFVLLLVQTFHCKFMLRLSKFQKEETRATRYAWFPVNPSTLRELCIRLNSKLNAITAYCLFDFARGLECSIKRFSVIYHLRWKPKGILFHFCQEFLGKKYYRSSITKNFENVNDCNGKV